MGFFILFFQRPRILQVPQLFDIFDLYNKERAEPLPFPYSYIKIIRLPRFNLFPKLNRKQILLFNF